MPAIPQSQSVHGGSQPVKAFQQKYEAALRETMGKNKEIKLMQTQLS